MNEASKVATPARDPAANATGARFSNKWWVLAVLTLIYISGFIDRVAIGVLGQSIKAEFGLTDWQLGLLNGLAFSLTYTVLAIPIARLSERYSRISIISTAAAVWSVMTAVCGLATSFLQLLLYRAGVGVGEAGCTAPSQAVITDYFPPAQRGVALSIYHVGVPGGVLVGGAVGGWVAQNWGWRSALVAFAVPGLVGALLLRLTVREPRRGMADAASGGSAAPAAALPSFMTVLKKMMRMPAIIHITIGMTLAIMGNASVKAFTVPFLIRKFEVSVAQAGASFGLFSGGSAIVGTVLGGLLADAVAKRNPAWLSWVPAISVLLGGPAYVLALHQSSFAGAMVWLSISGVLMYGYIGSGFAAIHNQVQPNMRATIASVVFLAQSLIGFGLGPPLVGLISDLFAGSYFGPGAFAEICGGTQTANSAACGEAAAMGLEAALSMLGILFVWSALHFYLAGRALSNRVPTHG